MGRGTNRTGARPLLRSSQARLFGIVVTVALLGFACQSGTPTTSPQASGACQHSGGTFVIAGVDEPGGITLLSPTGTDSSLHVGAQVWNQVVQLDFQNKPIPDLADSWDISSDHLTYTFHLNPKAKWHDGLPFTADDIVFNVNSTWPNTSRWQSWGPNIESVTAQDAHTAVIKLKAPFAPFLDVLGDVNMETWVYPKHIMEKDTTAEAQGNDPINQNPIGTGPFKFSKWVKGSHIELVRNTDYFKPGKPCLDKVVVQFLPDETARNLAFERGDIDFLNSYLVPFNKVATYRKNSKYQVLDQGLETPSTVNFVYFNTKNTHLQKREVRQALAFAIDRNQILQDAFFGVGKVAQSIFGSHVVPFYTSQYDVYRVDIAKANSLLDQAGFPKGSNGKRFSLRLIYDPGTPFETRTATVIQSDLGQVGVDVSLVASDSAALDKQVYIDLNFDMVLQLRSTGPDPTMSIPRVYSSKFIGNDQANGMSYTNPELESIFASEFSEIDSGKRKTLWDRAQQILMTDLPGLPLTEQPDLNLASAKFKDVCLGGDCYLGTREVTQLAS